MSKENNHSMLGLENNLVRLIEYTPLWAVLYREEEEHIMAAIGHLIIDLQHIGSTSIPGIKAKPILDMMAGVAQLDKALVCQAPLEAIGYDYIAEAGIANDYVCGKGVARTHYLHVVEYGGREVDRSSSFPRPFEERSRVRTSLRKAEGRTKPKVQRQSRKISRRKVEIYHRSG